MNSKTYWIVKGLVIAEAIICFAFSYSHILKVVQATGTSGWFPYFFPLMIDGLAVLGFIGRTATIFDESAQKAGTYIMIGVGIVSLICNVAAGENMGQRLLGAATVALFVAAEWFASKLNKRKAPEAPKTSPLAGKKWTPEMKERARKTRAENAYKNANPVEKRQMARSGKKPATV